MMGRVIYNLLLILFLPVIFPYLLWRVAAGKETSASIAQKLGFFLPQRTTTGGVWIHAVSVGEVNASIPLAELLIAKGKNVVFSVSTRTGMGLLEKRLKGKVGIAWFPLDLPFAVNRALRNFSPSAAVFLETEIWPNFIYSASARGVKCFLANGRISDRSFTRYLAIRPLIAPVLGRMRMLLMQSDADAKKISALGGKKIAVTGNIKFDLHPPAPLGKDEVKEKFGIPAGRPVVIFASTHPGEEELFLETARNLSAERAFFVLVPRHVDRAGEVFKLCVKYGFEPVTRSSGKKGGSLLVMDTIGELAGLYEAADAAVIGGSFIPHGGQNPLEGAAWGVPVTFGPHMENFREASRLLLESGGAKQARNRVELETILRGWLTSHSDAGENGKRTVRENGGALERTAGYILEALNG